MAIENISSTSSILSTRQKMNRINFTSMMPTWLAQYCDTIPKVVNNLLILMGASNVFLLMSVLQATVMPNLGVSPVFVAFLLCAQNALTWFALNNHRLSHLPSIVCDDFVLGCLLGISVGGSIVAFILSQFFGEMSNCVKITMTNYDYECKHQGTMRAIWFWSGLDFWFNTFISVLMVVGRDEFSILQQHSYENIGLALDELQSNFQRTAVYSQSPGDGTFFGSRPAETAPSFPTTPSEEAAAIAKGPYGGYGAESGFSDDDGLQPAADKEREAKQLFV
jgi:hypothetical protein